MKKIFVFINIVIRSNAMMLLYISMIFLLTSSPAKAEAFFNTLYDVPIMPGLSEVSDMALSFDRPDGRIAQAGALTEALSHESIYSFYTLSLAQLGWQQKQKNIYVRDGEKLEISIRKIGKSSVVQFMLKPL